MLICYRYGFASESEHVDVLLDRVCVDLFHKIRCSEHCLHDILPPVLMRHPAHSFLLPRCNSNLHRVRKKRGHAVFNYNSRISWSIFITFVSIGNRMNTLQRY